MVNTISVKKFLLGTTGMAEYTKEKIYMYELIKMKKYIKYTSLVKGQRK